MPNKQSLRFISILMILLILMLDVTIVLAEENAENSNFQHRTASAGHRETIKE